MARNLLPYPQAPQYTTCTTEGIIRAKRLDDDDDDENKAMVRLMMMMMMRVFLLEENSVVFFVCFGPLPFTFGWRRERGSFARARTG